MSSIAAVLLIALPWLNPFSTGPTPAVVPLLFSWVCTACLLAGCGLVAARFRTDSLTRGIAAAWLLAALTSAFLGLVQYFGKADFFDGWINSTAVGEAFANLRQRNHFASLTNIGLAALVWWTSVGSSTPPGISTGARPTRSPGFTLGLVAAAALLALGNAASSSRTGLAQWVLVIGLAALWGGLRTPALRRVLLAAALAYAVATVALPWLAGLDPLTSGAWARLRAGDAACAGRLTLWSNVLHLIAQKPWLGWGWGELGYAHFVVLYPGDRFCDILDNAHNLPLHLAVELGLPFAVVACALCLWMVVRAKPWRETHPTRQLAWSVLALIGLHSLLEYPLWYGPFQMAVGLCVWMLWRTPSTAQVTAYHSESFRPVAPVWTAWLATVLIASCAYAAWDYWRISQLYLLPQDRASAYRDNTLEKVRGSWLFRNQVRFAELTTTALTPDNAVQLNTVAHQLLHFSAEPRVVEKLIDSVVMLGRDDEARFFMQRYEAAFPQAYARWFSDSARHETP